MLTRRTFVAGMVPQGVVRERTARKQKILLVAGESEHKSEATLSGLAQELEGKHGYRCTVLTAEGPRDIPGLEALEDVDAAMFFLSSLDLPRAQMEQIKTYVNARKPIAGIRSTINAFNNWPDFGEHVLGAPWRYDYGRQSSTDVRAAPEAAKHPVLEGVPAEFHCRSPLYHVLPIARDAKPLLIGTSVGESDRAERAPNPVAWTKGNNVFYTSLGHPDDFQVPAFRTLLVNGVRWLLTR